MAEELRLLTEGIDADNAIELISKNAYLDGRNLHIGPGLNGMGGGPRKLKGTLTIPWGILDGQGVPVLPAGDNKCLGFFTDDTGNTLVGFIFNSLGNHCVLWFHPSDTYARTIPAPELRFTETNPVTGCVFINQRDLIFTDGNDYIKSIDLPRADDTNKKSEIRLYLPHETRIVQNRRFRFRTSLNGIPQGATIQWDYTDQQAIMGFAVMLRDFANHWNNDPTLSLAFTATARASHIDLVALNTGMYSIVGTITDTIGTAVQPAVDAIVEYRNRYNTGLSREQVQLKTVVPPLPPSAIMSVDPAVKTNFVKDKMLQFTYGYRFRNHQKSNTSPLSDLALPSQSVCGAAGGGAFNCIDIGFDDKWLLDPAMRGEIESIDIYMQDAVEPTLYLVRTLEKHEWVYSRAWRFYNDRSLIQCDNTQVAASQTYIPHTATGLESIIDKDDNTMVVVANCAEGDDNPEVGIVAKVVFNETVNVARGTGSIKGRVFFHAGFNPLSPYALFQPVGTYDGINVVFGGMRGAAHTGDPQTWGQILPLGGLPVYCAGTDKFCITTQHGQAIQWQAPQGSAAAGRNVFDLTTANARGSARIAIQAGQIWQDFEITGLEPGETYVVRIASNQCDRLGGSGGRYDIDAPGLDWQNTSTRTWGVGSIVAPNIKPGKFECTVTIPANGAGVAVDIGDCVVYDTTNPEFIYGSSVIDGYLMDSNGLDDFDAPVRNGVAAERQLVAFRYIQGAQGIGAFVAAPDTDLELLLNDGTCYSDHNGFFWFFNERSTITPPPPVCTWLATTGTPGSPSGAIQAYLSGGVTATWTILNNVIENKYEGDWGAGVLTQTNGPLISGPGHKRFFIPNLNMNAAHRRTFIEATVTTLSGDPVQDVSFILEGGHHAITDVNGQIRYVAYADVQSNQNDRGVDRYSTIGINDRLVLRGGGLCPVSFAGNAIRACIIPSFESGANHDDSHHFMFGSIIVTVSAISGRRCFGRGSSHGLAYYLKRDANGDRTASKPIGRIGIPKLTDDLNVFSPLDFTVSPTYSTGAAGIEVTINGSVPIPQYGRFTHLQFCKTRENTRQWYLQWVIDEQPIYSSAWTPDQNNVNGGAPASVPYNGGQHSEIYISHTDSTTRFMQVHSAGGSNLTDPNVAYQWAKGDMLRILTDSNGVPRNGIGTEVPITKQRGKWLVIESTTAVQQLFGGELVEIYRPQAALQADTEPYYDIPGGIIEITDPYGPNPSWGQSTILLENGDSWILARSIPIRPNDSTPWSSVSVICESPWMSDNFKSLAWGKGKVSYADPDAKFQRRGSLYRYTDTLVPGTNIDGLNMMKGTNVRNAENSLGPIQKLVVVGQELLSIGTNGSFSNYIGVLDLESGNGFLTATGGILGNKRPFVHRHGTLHRSAVAKSPTTVMFFDQRSGDIIQWGSNALQGKGFQEHAWSVIARKAFNLPDSAHVTMGYDPLNHEFLLSFPAIFFEDADGAEAKEVEESIVYHDDSNHFIGRMDWNPDAWGSTRLKLYSFKDGQLFLHDATLQHNVLGGVQYPLEVTVPLVGQVPMEVKNPHAIWLSRGTDIHNPGWEVPRVESIEGEVSLIPKSKFAMQEGSVVKGDFQQSMTGRVLASTAFRVTLRHDGPKQVSLLWVRFQYGTSKDT